MENLNVLDDRSNSEPESVFLGPLLDNVLEKKEDDIKATLAFHGIFYDRLYIHDAPLLNHRTFYQWYTRDRDSLASWFRSGLLVPCLRQQDGSNKEVRDFIDLAEAQDQEQLVAHTITEHVKNPAARKEYAKFLSQYMEHAKRYNIDTVAEKFRTGVEAKVRDKDILKECDIDNDIGYLLQEFIDFTLKTGRLTRSNIYHLAEAANCKKEDLQPDVISFAQSTKLPILDLQRRIRPHGNKVKSFVDAIYNGNLPLNFLGTSTAVPLHSRFVFRRAWAPLSSSEGGGNDQELSPITTLESSLITVVKALAKVEAEDLLDLRRECSWEEYNKSLRLRKCNFKVYEKHATTASNYITEILLQKVPSFRSARQEAAILGKVQDILPMQVWEVAIHALGHKTEILSPGVEFQPGTLEYASTWIQNLPAKFEDRKKLNLHKKLDPELQIGASEIAASL